MSDTGSNLTGAIEQWGRALGRDHVLVGQGDKDRYARSTSPSGGAEPGAVLLPESTEQVQQIVKIAAEHKTPVHPLSRGKNWGYGDASPPTDGQVIVDLARMNRIVEVNESLAYAVIEPGVSQGALAAYLAEHHPDLWLDCTGAGVDSSFVGNTLDRGFGHSRYADHFLTTCGMRVVMADGRVLETGFGHFPNAKAHRVYRYGVGPFLDGLFAQSNYGIVTQVGVWLMPRPESFCAYFFSGRNESDLEEIVTRLAPLRLKGYLQSALHIANDLRIFSSRARYPWELAGGATPLPEEARLTLRRRFGVGAWNGLGAIYGTPGSVKAMKRAVGEALRPFGVKFIDDGKLALARRLGRAFGAFGFGKRLTELVNLVEPVYGLLKGQPTNEPLAGMGWRVRGDGPPAAIDPLDAHAGIMWVSPMLPLSAQAAREVLDLIEPIYRRHRFEPLVTFTMITDRAMVCVTNISFDRREVEEAAAAKVCYDELVETLLANGYVPYRTGPGGYEKLSSHPSVFWDVAGEIKKTLDPGGIISPGRYIRE